MTRTTVRLTHRAEAAETSTKTWEGHYNTQKAWNEKLKADHAKALDAIIDALGIRKSYPDITSVATGTRSTYVHGGYSGYYATRYNGGHYVSQSYEYEVTDYGRDRFVKDALATSKSKSGQKAAARVAAAIKSAK